MATEASSPALDTDPGLREGCGCRDEGGRKGGCCCRASRRGVDVEEEDLGECMGVCLCA